LVTVAVGMTIADRPPAQIRTSAFTHTALNQGCVAAAPARGEEIRSSIAGKVQDVRDTVRERFSAERKKPATGTEGK